MTALLDLIDSDIAVAQTLAACLALVLIGLFFMVKHLEGKK